MGNNDVLMVMKKDMYLSVFYSDGKHVYVKEDLSKYKIKVKNKYKNPILINESILYPTKNSKDTGCVWVNIKWFKENDEYFNYLLDCFDLYAVTKKIYIHQMLSD